jgi:hypothetical protein
LTDKIKRTVLNMYKNANISSFAGYSIPQLRAASSRYKSTQDADPAATRPIHKDFFSTEN